MKYLNGYIQILFPIILTLLTAILGYIGKNLRALLPHIVDALVLKIGSSNYNKVMSIGWDAWRYADENYRISQKIGDEVQSKVVMFESFVKRKIPNISDQDLEDIRQAIAGEINKDKPLIVQAVQEPIIQTVKAQTVTKYVTPDTGQELILKS